VDCAIGEPLNDNDIIDGILEIGTPAGLMKQ